MQEVKRLAEHGNDWDFYTKTAPYAASSYTYMYLHVVGRTKIEGLVELVELAESTDRGS